MDRVVRLYQLWSWLPHFRAVAETEHLPTASEALGLSSSALSRALKQLENEVGCELFLRDGRAIRLNAQGRTLLKAVRLAMRSIDDALVSVESASAPLPLRVAAPGPFHGAVIVDLVARASAASPRLQVELSSCSLDTIGPALTRGLLDVCVHEGQLQHSDLHTRLLARVTRGLACARSHPLAAIEALTTAHLEDHEFVAPPLNDRGIREDGWPGELPRRIGLTVHHMQTGIDACISGHYLAVLPLPIIEAKGLVDLQVTGVDLPCADLYLTTRSRLETEPAEIARFLESLAEAFSGSLRETQ